MTFMSENLKSVYQAVINGDMPAAQGGVQEAVDSGVSAAEILNSALIPAMGEVGRLFEEGEYFVPEMLIAARAMKAALEIIKPLLVDSGVEPIGKFAVGTVSGDLHDIGKNLVAIMMEGAGFEIVDLGTDVNPNDFVSAAKDGANVIGLSALLTTTMPNMAGIINAIEGQGLRDQVKIIVGGAPITAEYAAQIGADGYAPDASQAVTLAKKLIL
jgi:5-methyltetrahydrofolate--homocysteine methyltransferase